MTQKIHYQSKDTIPKLNGVCEGRSFLHCPLGWHDYLHVHAIMSFQVTDTNNKDCIQQRRRPGKPQSGKPVSGEDLLQSL